MSKVVKMKSYGEINWAKVARLRKQPICNFQRFKNNKILLNEIL